MSIQGLIMGLFGGGRNVVKETAEIFIPNAEASAQRGHSIDVATLRQFASEFQHPRKGWFDRFVDGMNRLPRPIMVFACFGLLVATPIWPLRMTEVFTAWSLIPTGMWTIIGGIVAFYFGGRAQIKAQDFQKGLADTFARAPTVIDQITRIREMRFDSPGIADTGNDVEATSQVTTSEVNPALEQIKEMNAQMRR